MSQAAAKLSGMGSEVVPECCKRNAPKDREDLMGSDLWKCSECGRKYKLNASYTWGTSDAGVWDIGATWIWEQVPD